MEKRTYTASESTKHALAAALKALMAQRPLDKITINDITELCSIRRQNFYYHFADVYDLLRWTFEEENRAVCCCVLKSVGRATIKRFFEADIYTVIHRTVDQISADIGLSENPSVRADTDLLTHFYVVALVGVMESWLLGEIDRTPQELIAFADRLLQDHVRGAVIRLRGSSAPPTAAD